MENWLHYVFSFCDWFEHHGTLVSLLGLGTGSVGALIWTKLEGYREITIKRNAVWIDHGGVDDVKVVFYENESSSQISHEAASLVIITFSIRNTGRRDIAQSFDFSLAIPEGALLRCRPTESSIGVKSHTPTLSFTKAREVTTIEFEVPALKRAEFINFQIYAECQSLEQIKFSARPMDVKVKNLDSDTDAGSSSWLMHVIRILGVATIMFGIFVGCLNGWKSNPNPDWTAAIISLMTGLIMLLMAIYIRIRDLT